MNCFFFIISQWLRNCYYTTTHTPKIHVIAIRKLCLGGILLFYGLLFVYDLNTLVAIKRLKHSMTAIII